MMADSMECRQMPEIIKIVGILMLLLFIGGIKCFLHVLKKNIGLFKGIVEMDETYFWESQKGQKDIKNHKSRKRGGSSTFGIHNMESRLGAGIDDETTRRLDTFIKDSRR